MPGGFPLFLPLTILGEFGEIKPVPLLGFYETGLG